MKHNLVFKLAVILFFMVILTIVYLSPSSSLGRTALPIDTGYKPLPDINPEKLEEYEPERH